MKLENKIAVVTGGGRGIGRAIAIAFAAEGADVVVMARTADQLAKTAVEVTDRGRRALAVVGDLAKKSDIQELVRKTLNQFGPPDILVNNVGITTRALVVEGDDEEWKDVVHTNVIGTYLCTKYFLEAMLPRKTGRIINIASIAGKVGHPFNSAYCASKHAILGFTKTVALEMAILGTPEITINAICPGATNTQVLNGDKGLFAFLADRFGITKEEAANRVVGASVQARLLDPKEIAAMAVHLASDEGRGITGQAINVDGGQVMG